MNTSFHVDYHREYNLGVLRAFGFLTEESLDQMMHFALGMETGAPDRFNRLIDLTSVTGFPVQSAAIHRFAGLRREDFEHFPPFRLALIAPNPDAKDMAGIYKALMKGSKLSVGIFDDAKSAAEWLGVPAKVVKPQPAVKGVDS